MDLSWRVFGFQLSGETIYGLLIGWNGLLVMLIELPLTAVTLRFEPRRTIALGYLLLGAGFSMNAVAGTLPLLFVAMTIFTFGEMISAPVASAYVARMAPPQFRGWYMGVLELSWSLSSIIGPPVGLHLIESGWRSGWLFVRSARTARRDFRAPIEHPASSPHQKNPACPLVIRMAEP